MCVNIGIDLALHQYCRKLLSAQWHTKENVYKRSIRMKIVEEKLLDLPPTLFKRPNPNLGRNKTASHVYINPIPSPTLLCVVANPCNQSHSNRHTDEVTGDWWVARIHFGNFVSFTDPCTYTCILCVPLLLPSALIGICHSLSHTQKNNIN